MLMQGTVTNARAADAPPWFEVRLAFTFVKTIQSETLSRRLNSPAVNTLNIEWEDGEFLWDRGRAELVLAQWMQQKLPRLGPH
jgi:hypothetical protein